MQTATATISCSISNTDPSVPLGIEIWLDRKLILDQPHISVPVQFVHIMPDEDGEHEICWLMKNKTIEHTKLDEQGNIIKDACLIIKDVKLDDIELEEIFYNEARYYHDFNGTCEPIEQNFYGEMGCNGSVSLKFTTPIYLWLLENL